MKTYETKKIERDTQILRKATCDRCEKEIEILYNKDNSFNYRAVFVEISVGYGSRYDFTANENNWGFDICDDCVEEWLKTFKKDYLTVHWDEDK